MEPPEVTIRPVRVQDEAAERRFFSRTHIDQHRHAAFVCEHRGEIVGEARYVANPDRGHHTGKRL